MELMQPKFAAWRVPYFRDRVAIATAWVLFAQVLFAVIGAFGWELLRARLRGFDTDLVVIVLLSFCCLPWLGFAVWYMRWHRKLFRVAEHSGFRLCLRCAHELKDIRLDARVRHCPECGTELDLEKAEYYWRSLLRSPK